MIGSYNYYNGAKKISSYSNAYSSVIGEPEAKNSGSTSSGPTNSPASGTAGTKMTEVTIMPSMLFRKEVPVRIRSTDREEKAESLCLSVNMTSASRSKPIKVRHLC